MSFTSTLKAISGVIAGRFVGTHANAWDAAAVAIDGESAVIDVAKAPHLTVFGNASAATDIIVLGSQDGTNFYQVDTTTLAGAADFAFHLTTGMAYVKLRSSAAATITATVAGKG